MDTITERRFIGATPNNAGFVRDVVKGRREDALQFLAAQLHAIELGERCLDNATLLDMAKGLKDAIGNIVGAGRKDLGRERGLEPDDANIDTAAVEGLIAKLERAEKFAGIKGY